MKPLDPAKLQGSQQVVIPVGVFIPKYIDAPLAMTLDLSFPAPFGMAGILLSSLSSCGSSGF